MSGKPFNSYLIDLMELVCKRCTGNGSIYRTRAGIIAKIRTYRNMKFKSTIHSLARDHNVNFNRKSNQ